MIGKHKLIESPPPYTMQPPQKMGYWFVQTLWIHKISLVSDFLGHHPPNRQKERTILTKPCLSEMLLVSLSLWNETTFCIHCSPVDGLSGCMYILFGISGSAFPATIHRLELEIQSSTKAKHFPERNCYWWASI